MRRVIRVAVPLGLLIATAAFMAARGGPLAPGVDAKRTAEALRIAHSYQSYPKGVILEGLAAGFDDLTSVTYDAKTNQFTINGAATYTNPVARSEFRELLQALRKDDRLGVSLTKEQGRVIVYGGLSRNSRIIENLFDTDRLLTCITFGITEHLPKGIVLPENYKPQTPADRPRHVVACYTFTNYRFVLRDKQYLRVGLTLDVVPVPVLKEKTPEGGHLVDQEALRDGLLTTEDLANKTHIERCQDAYCRMMPIAQTALYGEATSFARLLVASRVDLDALEKQLR
jgi:hypothetical protein